ncbi:hypothetical protein [Bifidobacterium parmae]|uniref:DoxX n=1 Tax=Bifidobacterium parmae TaxID=361854 RepID=A0A2N5IZY5_9BIFI|nr:hypothetical protein [Bifidobacterium parmae]PLS27519.1 DoxX [Bifidobacterium parmae]
MADHAAHTTDTADTITTAVDNPTTYPTDTSAIDQSEHVEAPAPSTTYTPVFDDRVRTVIYIVTLVAGIVGAGITVFGDPQIGAYVSAAAGVIASAFGTAYSPMRLNGK